MMYHQCTPKGYAQSVERMHSARKRVASPGSVRRPVAHAPFSFGDGVNRNQKRKKASATLQVNMPKKMRCSRGKFKISLSEETNIEKVTKFYQQCFGLSDGLAADIFHHLQSLQETLQKRKEEADELMKVALGWTTHQHLISSSMNGEDGAQLPLFDDASFPVGVLETFPLGDQPLAVKLCVAEGQRIEGARKASGAISNATAIETPQVPIERSNAQTGFITGLVLDSYNEFPQRRRVSSARRCSMPELSPPSSLLVWNESLSPLRDMSSPSVPHFHIASPLPQLPASGSQTSVSTHASPENTIFSGEVAKDLRPQHAVELADDRSVSSCASIDDDVTISVSSPFNRVGILQDYLSSLPPNKQPDIFISGYDVSSICNTPIDMAACDAHIDRCKFSHWISGRKQTEFLCALYARWTPKWSREYQEKKKLEKAKFGFFPMRIAFRKYPEDSVKKLAKWSLYDCALLLLDFMHKGFTQPLLLVELESEQISRVVDAMVDSLVEDESYEILRPLMATECDIEAKDCLLRLIWLCLMLSTEKQRSITTKSCVWTRLLFCSTGAKECNVSREFMKQLFMEISKKPI